MSRDEMYYTPGRLARKLGVSKGMVMNHLNRTGLIHACRRGSKGQLQIPYSIALRVAGGNEKALAVPVKYTRPRRKQEKLTESLFEKPQKPAFPRRKHQLPSPDKTREGEDRFDYYRKIGESLIKLGITPEDLLKFYGLEGKDETTSVSQEERAGEGKER